MSQTLEWARKYVALGWSVFPVLPRSKKPAVEWKQYQTRLPTDEELTSWFATGENNIAIATGRRSGIVVVDIDDNLHKGRFGSETWDDLTETHGGWLAVTSHTGGGGRHLIFLHPGGTVSNGTNVLGNGLDVRGDGGYIIAPPSVHETGRPYAWDVDNGIENLVPTPLPDWIKPALNGAMNGAMNEAPAHPRASNGLGLLGNITDGRESYMRDTVLACLIEWCGTTGSVPTEDELFETAWDQYRKHVDFSRPGRGPDEMRAKIRYTLGRFDKGQIRGLQGGLDDAVKAFRARDVPERPQEAPQETRFQPVYLNELKSGEAALDFVENLLVEKSLIVLYGESNTGKTFATLDIAMHTALGRPWRGREVDAGAVIYCALEGVSGIKNRISAWLKLHHVPAPEKHSVPLAVIPAAVNLLDPEADVQALVDAIQTAATAMRQKTKLIVVDTLSRALAGGNENSPEDMGALVRSADLIRQKSEAALLFVHHSGKDQARGARGHSLLRAAVDTEIEITKEAGSKVAALTITKQRELEIDPQPVMFGLEVVDLGKNRRGKPLTSAVAVAVEQPQEAAQSPRKRDLSKLPPAAVIARRALDNVLARHGHHVVRDGIPSSTQVVTLDIWRRECVASGLSSGETNAQLRAFARAVERLVAVGVAVVSGDYAWRV